MSMLAEHEATVRFWMKVTDCTREEAEASAANLYPSVPTPTSAQHNDKEDGTVVVVYFREGEWLGALRYDSKREASIESTRRLFPGTSREWLERMHAR